MTRAASVQFAEPILFRVIRAHDWPTYDGWIWLEGYELNAALDAVARRSIFVQLDGLRAIRLNPPAARHVNAGPRTVAGRNAAPIRVRVG